MFPRIADKLSFSFARPPSLESSASSLGGTRLIGNYWSHVLPLHCLQASEDRQTSPFFAVCGFALIAAAAASDIRLVLLQRFSRPRRRCICPKPGKTPSAREQGEQKHAIQQTDRASLVHTADTLLIYERGGIFHGHCTLGCVKV